MASIKGVKLTGIQSHEGAEGYTLYANVSVDGKRVGTVNDDAWGGPMSIDIPKEVQAELLERFKTYIKDAYIVDEGTTWQMDAEAVAKGYKEKTLPLMDVDTYDPLEFFFSMLADLAEMEKTYKKAVKKGYKAIVSAKYLQTKDGTPVDVTYFTNGSAKTYAEVVDICTKKSPAVFFKQYNSPDDFNIR